MDAVGSRRSMARSAERWSYARSGVDRGAIATALSALLGQVRFPGRAGFGRRLPVSGHYAGLVRLGRETVAITTDTVGTKTLLAAELDRWQEVGEDLVAINVNDLASVGARPAGIVDVVSCATPDAARFRAIGRGIDRGLRRAGCPLLGGETAVVPDIVRGIDLGATAIGYFPRRRRPILGDRIRPGDRVVGVPSSGAHANGFTLIRRLLREREVNLERPRPGGHGPVGRELLAPTASYVQASEALADLPGVTGLAHVSGGGVRNLLRLSPRHRFVLDRWPRVPGLFGWLSELGGLSSEEQFQTFNMGLGFLAVVRPGRADEAVRRLRRAGYAGVGLVGRVEQGRGVSLPALHLDYDRYA